MLKRVTADLAGMGPETAWIDLVEAGFARNGRGTGALTSKLVAFAAGHPQRAMQLADALWRLTDAGTSAHDRTWEEALAGTRANVDSGSERLYALLPSGHQKSLRALAAGGSIYGTAADVVDLSPGTASAADEALVGTGYLARRQGRLVIIDPLFADWIRRRFPV